MGVGVFRCLILALGFPFLFSCAPSSSSEVQAGVTGSQLQIAEELISKSILTTQAIPFGYAEDGCYARALLMAAQLAAVNIPSSALFAFADRKSNRSLEISDSAGKLIKWRYHVAPLFFNIDRKIDGPVIIDPSVASGSSSPMKVGDWLSKFKGDDPTVSLVITPGSCYGLDSALGERPDCFSKNLSRGDTLDRQLGGLVRTVEEMPSFRISDLNNACKILSEYNQSRSTPEDRQNSQSQLEKTVGVVVRALSQKNLVLNDDKFSCFVRADESFYTKPEEPLPSTNPDTRVNGYGQQSTGEPKVQQGSPRFEPVP